jgi:crossover junction endodeoxyribonuclease RuvC
MSISEQIHTLDRLAFDIVSEVQSTRPNVVVIEGLDMATSYGGQIERTVLWWSVVHQLHHNGVMVYVAPSSQLKIYATGSGNAMKGGVIEAVTRRWPFFETKGNDNAADAATAAALGMQILGAPFTELPKTHTRAVDGCRSILVAKPAKARKPAVSRA